MSSVNHDSMSPSFNSTSSQSGDNAGNQISSGPRLYTSAKAFASSKPSKPSTKDVRKISNQEPRKTSTDLGNLTRASRLLAHSSTNLNEIVGAPPSNTDSSTTSSSYYSNDPRDHLDLQNFRPTRDFGDFQILTNSPTKDLWIWTIFIIVIMNIKVHKITFCWLIPFFINLITKYVCRNIMKLSIGSSNLNYIYYCW